MRVSEIVNENRSFADVVTVARLISRVLQKLVHQGHSEIDTPALINMIIEKTGQSFTLKDLIDANERSPAVQKQISSIDAKKVKFSKEATTVTNDNTSQKDAASVKEKNQSTVAAMAARAIN